MKQLVQSVNAESHRARFKTHEELQKTTNSLITEADTDNEDEHTQ